MLQRVPLVTRLPRCNSRTRAHFEPVSLVCRPFSSQLAIADELLDSIGSRYAEQNHGSTALSSLPSTPPNATATVAELAFALPSSSRSTLPSAPTATLTALPSTASTSYKENFLVDGPFLACSEPGKQLKVGVLLSGGVDSSVALRLLLAAGHSCTAFYLKIWFQEDFENFWSSCPWDEDLKYAQAVCDEAGVELQVVQLTDDYWKHVVSYMIQEYRGGRTPNPDVLCNSRIKFGVFLDHVKDLGFDRVASGHYAKVVHTCTDSGGLQAVLQLSEDEVKDQTYFLSHLSQFQLSRLIFPLGCVSKSQVRKIAEVLGLPNKQRKDSQGICFLGKVKFSDFIARHLGESEGRIVEAETGTYLGSHRGYWFYTIGQRQGLRLSHGPWYVVDKDQENNVVFVSKHYFSVEKRRREFEVHAFNWLDGKLPEDLSGLRCKVRHGPRFYECSLSFEKKQSLKDTALVRLSDNDQGIAAGQYAAFYRGNVCLGSAVISEFRSNGGSAVSAEAREAAKMKELPVGTLSKSKKKKLASLQKKCITETGKEMRDVPSQEALGWLPRLQTLVTRFFSWIRLK
ncbi:hypothetical protein L7F22_049793 [Adiantum nelumboides]|nr:hypothetical protein [Adiantum nelumboides]